VIKHELASVDKHRASFTKEAKRASACFACEAIEFGSEDAVGEREGLHCVDTKRQAAPVVQHPENLVWADPVILGARACLPWLAKLHHNAAA
jgi:hypothetical protein